MHAHLLHMPISQCNFHPFTFYLPFHTSSPVDQCPIYAPSNCTMGLGTCARHSLFGRTDPYYTVILYSSCGLNKHPAATLAFLLSVSVLSSQYPEMFLLEGKICQRNRRCSRFNDLKTHIAIFIIVFSSATG